MLLTVRTHRGEVINTYFNVELTFNLYLEINECACLRGRNSNLVFL